MGVFKIGSASSFDFADPDNTSDNFNPNPNNYEIIEYIEFHNALVVKIKYFDCTNYEGLKILLFKNCTISDLKKQKIIDPHFSDNKNYHSPIARFEPTTWGWNSACYLASKINIL